MLTLVFLAFVVALYKDEGIGSIIFRAGRWGQRGRKGGWGRTQMVDKQFAIIKERKGEQTMES